MVGIDAFKQYFKGHENEYVIIGGTACEILMGQEDLPFRVTKDIDMVLIVESLTKEFGEVFWEFVKEADYQFINKGSGKAQFYRFSNPKSFEFPAMIELFSKSQDWISKEIENRITAIHIDDDISSLSAILLNDVYYDFLTKGTKLVNGVSILNVEHIIPFKAKAWIDLKQRKENGEQIDSRDIKKHKNDIFRLSLLLVPEKKVILSNTVKEDMSFFISKMTEEEIDPRQLGLPNISKEQVLKMLRQIYEIPLL